MTSKDIDATASAAGTRESSHRAHIDSILRQFTLQMFEIFDRIMTQKQGENWAAGIKGGSAELGRDTGLLIRNIVANDHWYEHFHVFGPHARTLLFEIRDWRNMLAHNEPLVAGDPERVADTVLRLFAKIDDSEERRFSEFLSIHPKFVHTCLCDHNSIAHDSEALESNVAEQIYSLLQANTGLTAKAIAKALNIRKSDVNSELYRQRDRALFTKVDVDPPMWHPVS